MQNFLPSNFEQAQVWVGLLLAWRSVKLAVSKARCGETKEERQWRFPLSFFVSKVKPDDASRTE